MCEKPLMSLDDLLINDCAKQIIDGDSLDVMERRAYTPPMCEVFRNGPTALEPQNQYRFDINVAAREQLPHLIENRVEKVVTASGQQVEGYSRPRTIGIVFSGGPAPGGHNVIAGLYDAAKKANPENKVYGFILGQDGIIEGNVCELTDERVNQYRNLGGFCMIKTGRTKIDTRTKMRLSIGTCKKLGLDALVVVGGDDSNTNAAFMAEAMKDEGIQVIGVPKTIDGDIQVKDSEGKSLCAISFGFHSAARSFARNIGDLCTDGSSDVKYWHFCKVMGRVASHLALEVSLQTHANLTLIGEDLAEYVDQERVEKARTEGTVDYTAYGMTLRHLSRVVCDAIVRRAAVGKNYGVVVIPEGVLEFINEVQVFIIKLNTIISEYNDVHDTDFHSDFRSLDDKLEYLRRLVRGIRKMGPETIWNARDDELFSDIPEFFKAGLLMERDSHGNFQFSQVETDRVILELVKDYLGILKEKGRYKVGIEDTYFTNTLARAGLSAESYGPVIFRNYGVGRFLLVKEELISLKTLKQALVKAELMEEEDPVPAAIIKIYEKSVPNLKVQTHFYGYDGRGSDPTKFDCTYTYNLGLTAFSLIAGGSTGQMVGIRNLEKSFESWEPLGIPIAPLMHLEERGGKMKLVLEKSVVELDSNAFRLVKAMREKWMAAAPGPDRYRKPGAIRFRGDLEEDKPMTLSLNSL
ncbi:6-phosphofructokinase [Desulfoluna spongiiphila]|uniref:Pyrophosphate--fructose-6-phosphate 1-phosphotransferase n=1 Tax=Desulfoluna spongiiphila TaxID=419481 RepID=A0A1G5H4V1_9BACT|nr:6-phosphofructokinase [Desulfoluna spongiiphila]SCY58833.1 pyrophosphate--fructose-6-phosphate 1-phosphotransferase [Desulfoluna spongiiphila]